MQQQEAPGKSFDFWHPCGDGSSIFLPHPVFTMVARMVIKNCLWVAIGLILFVIFIRYLLQPCYGDCKGNVIISGISGIPVIGNVIATGICLFACLYIGWFKFLFNGATAILGL